MEGWKNGILECWNDGMMEYWNGETEWNDGILGERSIYFGRYLANHPGSAFSGAIQPV